MKVKDLLLVLGIAVAGFTACTSENPIDGDRTGALAVSFSINDALTKATADGYTYASENEIKINDVHVALFTESGDLIEAKNATPAAAKESGKKDTYTVDFSDIDISTGANVFAYVIANAGQTFTDALTKSCSTYSDYEKAERAILTSSFSEDNLVKVGKSGTITLKINQSNLIPVELNQLTARIDWKGVKLVETKAAGTKGSEVTDTKTSYDYISGASDIADAKLKGLQAAFASAYSKANANWDPTVFDQTVWNDYWDASSHKKMNATNWKTSPLNDVFYSYLDNITKAYEQDDYEFKKDGKYWLYNYWLDKTLSYGGYFDANYSKIRDQWQRANDNGYNEKKEWKRYRYAAYHKRVVLVKKTVVETIENEEEFGPTDANFKVSSLSYIGANHKSDIAIYSTDEIENESSARGNSYQAFTKSFYTYENAALKLKVVGTYTPEGLEQTKPASKTKKTTTYYGYWIQERPNKGFPDKKENDSKMWSSESTTTNSWKVPTSADVEKNESKISWCEDLTETTEEPADESTLRSETGKAATYIIDLTNAKIVKGNIYSVTGKLTPNFDVEPTIEWEVVDMKGQTVNIPAFE